MMKIHDADLTWAHEALNTVQFHNIVAAVRNACPVSISAGDVLKDDPAKFAQRAAYREGFSAALDLIVQASKTEKQEKQKSNFIETGKH